MADNSSNSSQGYNSSAYVPANNMIGIAPNTSNQDQANNVANQAGFNISYSSPQELAGIAQGVGEANTIYGQNMATTGSQNAQYGNMLYGNLNKDYAGSDIIRQQANQAGAKMAGQQGLNGANMTAASSQMQQQGNLGAAQMNQDYQNKALAAYGNHLGNVTSGQAGLITANQGMGISSTPTPTPSYSAGSIICTELKRQGKLNNCDLIKIYSFVDKNISDETLDGYRFIARPIVKLMKKSNKFSNLFIGWSKSLSNGKLNMLSKLLIPLCWTVGYVRRIKKEKITSIA